MATRDRVSSWAAIDVPGVRRAQCLDRGVFLASALAYPPGCDNLVLQLMRDALMGDGPCAHTDTPASMVPVSDRIHRRSHLLLLRPLLHDSGMYCAG